MKQTIAISAFAGMLARQSGYTSDFCEHFVLEMFKTVADALKESNEVTIKGLGQFSVDESGNVEFSPDPGFAADVNAPFDCFEPEPLDEDVTDEILSADEENISDDSSAKAVENEMEVAAPENPTDIQSVNQTDLTSEDMPEDMSNNIRPELVDDEIVTDENHNEDKKSEQMTDVGTSEPVYEADLSSAETENTDEVGDFNVHICSTRPRKFPIWGFVCGMAVGAIVGAAATYFILVPRGQAESTEEIKNDEQHVAELLGEETTAASADTVSKARPDTITTPTLLTETTVPAVEKDTVIYDTVTSTLAQLSRKHFGSYEFWVYIYEENRDVISDPDRVEPNTRVRIPDAKKYGIDANDKSSIKRALAKSSEIANERKRKK